MPTAGTKVVLRDTTATVRHRAASVWACRPRSVALRLSQASVCDDDVAESVRSGDCLRKHRELLGTAATINTAITNCPSGQVVVLGSGLFTLSTNLHSHELRNSAARDQPPEPHELCQRDPRRPHLDPVLPLARKGAGCPLEANGDPGHTKDVRLERQQDRR